MAFFDIVNMLSMVQNLLAPQLNIHFISELPQFVQQPTNKTLVDSHLSCVFGVIHWMFHFKCATLKWVAYYTFNIEKIK